jgi:hygromycin-B 4-O-kinase
MGINLTNLTDGEVLAFLEDRFAGRVDDLVPLEGAAWSQAFGFTGSRRSLVVRFAKQADDYLVDQYVARFSNLSLPIPTVLDIGAVFDGCFAISERGTGEFLERVTASEWPLLQPALARLFDSLWGPAQEGSHGFSPWDEDGNGWIRTCREVLEFFGVDGTNPRASGRQKALRDSAIGDSTFIEAKRQLKALPVDPVDRALIHGDLLNRNVLYLGPEITAVFDWGCAMYGDFLYELAWFEFWAPWHPGIDPAPLRDLFMTRAQSLDVGPDAFDRRLHACLLAIGIDHLTYCAWAGE